MSELRKWHVLGMTILGVGITSAAMASRSRTNAEQNVELPKNNNISVEYGLLNNASGDRQTTQYQGMGLRYAYVFGKDFVFSNGKAHDQLAAEAGAFYYSIFGFQTVNDQVSVVPVVGTVRYSVNIGEYLSPFVYVGGIKNFSNQEVLTRSRIAAGGGTLLNLGRTWAIRLEYGNELFAAGAVVKL